MKLVFEIGDGWNRTNLSVRKLRLQLSGSPFTHRHTKIKKTSLKIWTMGRDLNPRTLRLQCRGLSHSPTHRLKKLGGHPESWTQNLWCLKPAPLPIGLGDHISTYILLKKNGAGRGTWTPTEFLQADFKPAACYQFRHTRTKKRATTLGCPSL